jgi:O-antigen/teichoic acid export membrane protein
MSVRQKAARGSVLLTVGEGVVYGSSLIRNMILARMLTKADFGIAATFALVVSLLEMSDKLGMARFVVRDKEANEPDFIAAAHLVHLAVAAVSSIVIVACAVPLSTLFGISEHRRAVLFLAFVPLCRGFEHLDVRRFERSLRFAPSLLVEAVPQLVITAAAWPVAHWLGDYRAVLVLLLTKGLISCSVSHGLAEQPYRWRLHGPYIRRMLKFGWPLVVNGFLTFGVFQGDQFLIAARYTITDLAPYAAAAALTMAPSFFFGRVFNSLMLPVLADVQDNSTALTRRYKQVLALTTVFAVVCALTMILGAESLMRLVYGTAYSGAGLLLAWLAAANAFRNLRLAPALAAMAKGDTQNQMISNGWRVTALLPAAVLAMVHAPIWLIATTGLFGEAVACWSSFVRLRRQDGFPLSVSLIAAGWVLMAVLSAGSLVVFGFHRLPTSFCAVFLIVAVSAGLFGTLWRSPELRGTLIAEYSAWRSTRGNPLECGAAESSAKSFFLKG